MQQARGSWTNKECAAKVFLSRQHEVYQWIQNALGTKLASPDLSVTLHDGLVLIALADKTVPGKISPHYVERKPATSRQRKQNIKLFLICCKKLSLPKDRVFEVEDLYRKLNMEKVVSTLHIFAAVVARRGFQPMLRVLSPEDVLFPSNILKATVQYLEAASWTQRGSNAPLTLSPPSSMGGRPLSMGRTRGAPEEQQRVKEPGEDEESLDADLDAPIERLDDSASDLAARAKPAKQAPPTATVRIELVSGVILTGAKEDPYVKFILGGNTFTSAVVKNTKTPTWTGQIFEAKDVDITRGEGRVTVELWDKDVFTKDDYLGVGSLELRGVPPGKETEEVVTCASKGEQTGQLTLKVTVTVAAPALPSTPAHRASMAGATDEDVLSDLDMNDLHLSQVSDDNLPDAGDVDLSIDLNDTAEKQRAPARSAAGTEGSRDARAEFDFEKQEPNQLSFAKGDLLVVYGDLTEAWWSAEKDGQIGYVPANYLTLLDDSPEQPAPAAVATAKKGSRIAELQKALAEQGFTGQGAPTGGAQDQAARDDQETMPADEEVPVQHAATLQRPQGPAGRKGRTPPPRKPR